MGLALNVAVLLRGWLLAHHANGPVATLGVMDCGFSEKAFTKAIEKVSLWASADHPMSAARYFQMCGGLNDLSSIDISKYEGADFEFDLNNESLPPELIGRFGVVLNGGTLEHVFHVPNALTNISRMLRPGGLAVHILPMSNCVDHGFYQFSPTLMLDYYAAAKFDLLNSISLHFSPQSPRWLVKPALLGSYGEGLIGTFDQRIAFHMLVARKRPDSLDWAIPIQSLYGRKFTGQRHLSDAIEWFSPFEIENGRRIESGKPTEFRIESFASNGGLMWGATLPDYLPRGDDSTSPISSSLALFEDGKLLGPPHSAHDTIQKIGRGAYSHWGGALFLSSSDGSDPNTNGRQYLCKL
ncbi:methyltransferase domain-containing protein [Bradyrhizobium elkanii]|uniref:methyltransferase domain-containing protein n=1 Tax=Bradyrhizobium elkanii TaxID=29448 RepID=UPI001BA8A436|nr:methyltransferase domain-containing protein [Bradyrhizobium elkanii]MBR1164083.1 methyltransferase domain-containing protein [Bradyrhizobium elkanii]